jgi:hypothetical protein
VGLFRAVKVAAVVAVVTATLLTSTSVGRSVADSSGTWVLQPSPDAVTPSGAIAGQTDLLSVACPLPTSCIAVGYSDVYDAIDGPVADYPLAEQWDGAAWTMMSVPAPLGQTDTELTGVSCPSADSCTAVGYQAGYEINGLEAGQPVVEQWDGTAWSVSQLSLPDGAAYGELLGVSCPSVGYCVAVGYSTPDGPTYDQESLVEIWEGSSWSIVASPNYSPDNSSAFYSVSCLSSSSCTAVGNEGWYSPLAARWDGTSWTVDSLPPVANSASGALYGVSCATSQWCVAVGDQNLYQGGLIYSWNGTTWTYVSLPSQAYYDYPYTTFNAVSCSSPNECVVVGLGSSPGSTAMYSGEQWDGTNWNVLTGTFPANGITFVLLGVTCYSGEACVAVGMSQLNAAQHADSLVESSPVITSSTTTTVPETTTSSTTTTVPETTTSSTTTTVPETTTSSTTTTTVPPKRCRSDKLCRVPADPAATTVPHLVSVGKSGRFVRNDVDVRLGCGEGASCRGSASLLTEVTSNGRRRETVVARGLFSVRAGRTETVLLKETAQGVHLFSHHHKATAELKVKLAGGNQSVYRLSLS